MDLIPPTGYVNLQQCDPANKINIYVLALEDAKYGMTRYGDHDVYLRVGDNTSRTKADPVFLHLYSKREEARQIAPKLVSGLILHLQGMACIRKFDTALYGNDKYGLVDIVYSPNTLTPDHAKFCRELLESTTPLCLSMTPKTLFPPVHSNCEIETVFPPNKTPAEIPQAQVNPQSTISSTTRVQSDETSLEVRFNDDINVPDLIKGLNVGLMDCGLINGSKCFLFFGMLGEVVKVEKRFKTAIGKLRGKQHIDRVANFEDLRLLE